jgi:cytochrome c oxidase subunit 1
MAMTETRPAPSDAVAAGASGAPADHAGLAGWFSTSDHKRIGRLYIATSLLFLLVSGVVGELLAAERLGDGFDIIGHGAFSQVYTFHGEAGLWLFIVPLLLGIATVIVPLQIGSPEVAFPRGTATAYWAYVVSGGLLVGAYLADGGPSGGEPAAVDLHLLALAGLTVATLLGIISLLTTILTMRAGGMTLADVPAFTWSVLVGGGLTLITAPVLLARLAVLYVTHHFGGSYDIADYGSISWMFSIPQVYLVAVPAAGVAFEVVPVLAGHKLRNHGAALVLLGLLGVVGLGSWAQVPETFDKFLYIAIGIAAVVPPLAILATLADTLRSGRPAPKAALLFALGSVLLLLAGAVVGALSTIDGLHLQGTVWDAAQAHLVLTGAAWLGALAALWWWAPKIYGAVLNEAVGAFVFLTTFVGVLALAVPDLINGLANDVALRTTDFASDSERGLNAVSVAGGGLVALGAVLVVLVLLGTLRRDRDVAADPWGGYTLEWATTSPPPASNFSAPLPAVTSPTPLLDGDS